MTDQPSTCGSCRFYEPLDGAPVAGMCHRYPPNSHPRVMGVEADDEAAGEPTKYPQFPLVDSDTWCGEYQAVPVVILDPGNVVAHEPWYPCEDCTHGNALHSRPDGSCSATTLSGVPCSCREFTPAEVPAG